MAAGPLLVNGNALAVPGKPAGGPRNMYSHRLPLPGIVRYVFPRWLKKRVPATLDLLIAVLLYALSARGHTALTLTVDAASSLPQGQRRQTMATTLHGNARIEPTLNERFRVKGSAGWVKDRTDSQTVPVDLSFLNATEKPAGKHGFLRVEGENLVFENGTRVRFWGTNVTASSIFRSSKVDISRHAKRLSALGFNLVRIHHHDSEWVNPNIFGPRPQLDTQSLSPASLDKIDWWIKSLKDEGIYVWLDLHVGRRLTRDDDIDAFEEISRNKKQETRSADLRGYNYVNPSIKAAMIRFNRQYLSHTNPYTRLAYKDDPAIIAVLITNENDITHHFGNRLLPDKNVPRHSRRYMDEAKQFARKHSLAASETWRSWIYGSSKLFLNDLEHRFNREMIDELRQIGVRVPIATTSTWGFNPLASLPSLTAGDIIDAHAYGKQNELENDPFLTPSMTTWLSAAQVAGKPMTVSEWNVSPFPVPDRHLAPLLLASKASHQGWDALMQYAYSKDPLDSKGKPSNWVSRNDPALLATLPAAALMYRRGHVREAITTYYTAFGQSMFLQELSPKTSVAIRTAAERGKLVIGLPASEALPWLMPTVPPENAAVLAEPREAQIRAGTTSITTDTGELSRDWISGTYTINTPNSQAVMGRVGGKTFGLADTLFKLDSPDAAIAIQSLDASPISESDHILISMASLSVPYKDSQGAEKLPFLSRALTGNVTIAARPGLHLYHLQGRSKISIANFHYQNGAYQIDLDALPVAHWFVLSAAEPDLSRVAQ